MADEFRPSRLQQRLIDAANAAAREALEHGHPAPKELVRRMTQEGLFTRSEEATGGANRWQHQFRFAVEALFAGPLPDAGELVQRLREAGCLGARPYDGSRGAERSVALVFEVWAPSEDAALREAFRAMQEAFPEVLIGEFERPATVQCSYAMRTSAAAPPSCQGDAGCDLGVKVCVAVDQTIPGDVARRLLAPMGCYDAASFRLRPSIVVAEFLRFATSREQAEAEVLAAVQEVFGDATPMDLDLMPLESVSSLRELVGSNWVIAGEVPAASTEPSRAKGSSEYSMAADSKAARAAPEVGSRLAKVLAWLRRRP